MTTQQSHLSHAKYRPDIDGLRAIAVLSVVVFHAFPTWLTGGFIGVDVFFVISGYLISTIIFENLDQGIFSFSEFYSRRIRRIFPALLVVLTACFVFGWFVLLADEYKQLGKHIAAGASFVSNFALLNEAGYFDNSADTKPLLHLWSLGIEEQFYIVWPLLLWFAWKRKLNLLTITIVVAIATFILNLKGIKQDMVATFYSPHTRFWELLSGSLLAWITLYKNDSFSKVKSKLNFCLSRIIYSEKQELDGNTLANVFSGVGLLLLVYGFSQINKELSFPGKWALVPVLGAVLIISAGSKAWFNRTILSHKVVVWFGLISFPLYLWHWPILSFARIIESETPSRNIRIIAVLLSIVLAWVTYILVERPLRLPKHGKAKVVVLTTFMVIVGYIGYTVYQLEGFVFRTVNKINISINSGNDGGDGGNMVDECGIKDETIRKLFNVCAKDKRGVAHFALLGDSKAAALYTGLVRTSDEDARWLFIGGNSAHGSPVPLLSADPDPKRPLTNYAIEAILSNNDIQTVVLVTAIRKIFVLSDGVKSGNIATYDYTYLKNLSSSNRFNDAFIELDRVVEKFVLKGKKVVLVVDNPALPNPQDCINRKTSFEFINQYFSKSKNDCYLPMVTYESQIKIYRELLNKVQLAHPDSVRIFDPTDIYCDNSSGLCEAIKNGRLMYSYTDHISDYASGLVGHKLNEFVKLK